MHVRSDDSNLRPCASVPAVAGWEVDDLRLYLSGAVAERRLEEKLRSRTFSVTILSCGLYRDEMIMAFLLPT